VLPPSSALGVVSPADATADHASDNHLNAAFIPERANKQAIELRRKLDAATAEISHLHEALAAAKAVSDAAKCDADAATARADELSVELAGLHSRLQSALDDCVSQVAENARLRGQNERLQWSVNQLHATTRKQLDSHDSTKAKEHEERQFFQHLENETAQLNAAHKDALMMLREADRALLLLSQLVQSQQGSTGSLDVETQEALGRALERLGRTPADTQAGLSAQINHYDGLSSEINGNHQPIGEVATTSAAPSASGVEVTSTTAVLPRPATTLQGVSVLGSQLTTAVTPINSEHLATSLFLAPEANHRRVLAALTSVLLVASHQSKQLRVARRALEANRMYQVSCA
jgi:hypothetical protein